jgi:hypothetical protein
MKSVKAGHIAVAYHVIICEDHRGSGSLEMSPSSMQQMTTSKTESDAQNALALTRYSLAGALVGVALVGVFAPTGTHHLSLDAIGGFFGLIAVLVGAKYLRA